MGQKLFRIQSREQNKTFCTCMYFIMVLNVYVNSYPFIFSKQSAKTLDIFTLHKRIPFPSKILTLKVFSLKQKYRKVLVIVSNRKSKIFLE